MGVAPMSATRAGAWRRRPATPMGFVCLDPQQVRSQQVLRLPRRRGAESPGQPARRVGLLLEVASAAAPQMAIPVLRPERPARRCGCCGLAANRNQKAGVRRDAGIGDRKMRAVPGQEKRPRGLEVLSQIGPDPLRRASAGSRTVFYAGSEPSTPGCTLRRFGEPFTNWHCQCARAFLDGRLTFETC